MDDNGGFQWIYEKQADKRSWFFNGSSRHQRDIRIVANNHLPILPYSWCLKNTQINPAWSQNRHQWDKPHQNCKRRDVVSPNGLWMGTSCRYGPKSSDIGWKRHGKIWTVQMSGISSPTLILSGKDLPRNIIAILCDNHLSTLKTNPHSLNTSKWLAIFFPWVKPLSWTSIKGCISCCENLRRCGQVRIEGRVPRLPNFVRSEIR